MNSEIKLSLPSRLRREIQAWDAIQPIAADGSDRQFFRLQRPGDSCICLYHPQPPGEPVTENDSYDFIGRHLRRQGAPVPEIYSYCREEGWFLLEDLGDRSMQEECQRQADENGRLALYHQALQVLVQMQIAGTQGFSPEWGFDTPFYDVNLVRARECHYFVEAFLQGYLGLETTPEALTDDFELLLQRALHPEQKFFLHRDFQSRNLMVHHNRLWLIDFQGARLGPLQYDLAALLLDPYMNLPFPTQEILLTAYLRLLQEHLPLDPVVWRQRYNYVALCRNLQILGAYGFLSRQKGKTFFQQFIPAAWRSLQQRLEWLPEGDFRGLRRVAAKAAARVRHQETS
jgi:aminoglycoside/choline kinase family phosphotransferase